MSPTEQHMEGEGAAVGGGYVLQYPYCILTFIYQLQDPVPSEGCARGVIGLLPLALHKNKPLPKVPEVSRKRAHRGPVVALVSGVTVLQCPVCLLPRRVISVGPGQPIRPAQCQRMEQGVIGGADSSTQFSLPGSAPTSADGSGRQLPSDSYQVSGVHWILSLYTFFHSNLGINEWPAYKGHSSSESWSNKRPSIPSVHLGSSFFRSPS